MHFDYNIIFNPAMVTTYTVPPFSMAEICNITNLLETELPSPPPMQRSGGVMPAALANIDYTGYDEIFTLSAITWMRNRTGDGEQGIVARNDALCTIFQHLAAMGRYSRNKREDSTVLATRSARADKYGGVILVMTEEKDASLAEAQDDLCRKFRWLPHFSQLPFIFGMAITHDQMTIHTMHREAPTIRKVFSADLTVLSDRWKCVVAAVNIARTILGFVAEHALIPSPLRFDMWHERNAKRMRLGMQFVEVQFEFGQYLRMRHFYASAAGVPHLEHPIAGDDAYNEASGRIKLAPVGVNRQPSTLPELLKCVKDISSALFGLHERRLVHCDVQWSNIIEYFGDWYLIDCEYACSLADDRAILASRSQNIRSSRVMDSTTGWTSKHDLYQMGLLLKDVDALTNTSPALRQLRDSLLSKKFNIAAVKKLVHHLS